MSKKQKNAAVGIERTRKRKKHLDNLTKDVLAAQEAGMSYGQYKALHPHTKEDDEPEELVTDCDKKALVCIQCGKTFVVPRYQTNKKYCSEGCRDKAYLARKRELHPEIDAPRLCRACGKPLEENHKGVYCSPCRASAYRRKDMEENPEKYTPKPCPVCGKPFIPTYGRKYCSDTCQKIENGRTVAKNKNEARRRQNPEKYTPVPCPVCGEPVTPTNGRKYCSDICKWRAQQRRRTEQKREAAKNAK